MSRRTDSEAERSADGSADRAAKPHGLRARLLRWLPATLVALFGAALLWPVSRGQMPLSADHTVHLSRAWMVGQELANGRLTAWSDLWFFGFPLGELYPPLGDLAVNAMHALGFGAMEWPTAYALTFTLVFILQGWVMLRLGRALGLGPLPGLIAALLLLADPGFSREGGWMYTVYFGVWPQVLATSLVWLGFAELGLGHSPDHDARPRPALAIARAALCFGGGLLAHPMALMMLAIGGPIYLLAVGARKDIDQGGSRLASFRQCASHLALAFALGLAIAAWWWLPMLAHRGWMASYGWLFQPLSTMVHWALDGRWAQRMPAAVGYCAMLGISWAALRGRGFARFVVAFALVQWACASTDLFWDLRLDRVSEGFTHLQYQRFLIAAKPGFFLAAGAAIGALAQFGLTMLRKPRPLAKLTGGARKGAATAMLCMATVLVGWLAIDTRAAMAEHEVGQIQLERLPGHTEFEADYQEFLVWARERWDERDQDYRIAFRDGRNVHWFMDSTPSTHTPLYKAGFTPGDNFVHKPESRDEDVLDALGVRYVVARSNRQRPLRGEVARFGEIRVLERATARPLAWIRGNDAKTRITSIEGSPRQGRITVELADPAPDEELVFAVAGYPRWQSSTGTWTEVPVVGDGSGLEPSERAAGRVRGGKALGDDGSEPTLIAVRVGDHDRIELRYQRVGVRDVLATILGVLATLFAISLATTVGGLRRPLDALRGRFEQICALIARPLHPITLVVTLVLIIGAAGYRWIDHAREEARTAVGWVEHEQVRERSGVRIGPLKTDMLIRPAVLLKRSRNSRVTFPSVALGDRLQGWIAVEDDMAKSKREGRLRFEIQARHADGDWSTLLDMPVHHRPNRVPISVDCGELAGSRVDLRVRAHKTGGRAPLVGFDLELGDPPGR